MWIGVALVVLFSVNAMGAAVTVFRQPRDIAATWAWLLVLLLLPVVGFVLYWMFGRKLSTHKLTSLATQQRLGIDQRVAAQQDAIARGATVIPATAANAGVPELARTLLQADGALITGHNAVELISTRSVFTARLFADMGAATDHIHIEAYTIAPDNTGLALRALLTEKAKAGVRVRVIYDTFGSHQLKRGFWAPLIAAGGQVEPFIATRLARANLRINFRNHRKLTVIDGAIGYLGGFDIGTAPHRQAITRDTQLRVTGQAVASMQARFFMDWNTTARIKKVHFQQAYFPAPAARGTATVQIVGGGPEQPLEALKLGYLRLLALAKSSIWIQTPYFVPDDSLLDALTIAASSGIDVRVMVPARPNQPMMGRATRFYLERLVAAGGRAYLHQNGFLHSKTIVVDGAYLALGSANLDIRSFKLNFEIAAFIYDGAIAHEAAKLFRQDLTESTPYTRATVLAKTRGTRFKEELSRLLAPIL